jgi:hypothetical protein
MKDMIYRKLCFHDKDDVETKNLWVVRHTGERNIWIEEVLFGPLVSEKAQREGAALVAHCDEQRVIVISVDWFRELIGDEMPLELSRVLDFWEDAMLTEKDATLWLKPGND